MFLLELADLACAALFDPPEPTAASYQDRCNDNSNDDNDSNIWALWTYASQAKRRQQKRAKCSERSHSLRIGHQSTKE